MKVRIAAFKHTRHGWISFYEETDSIISSGNYHRTSEWVDVELFNLPQNQVVEGALEFLSIEEKETRGRFLQTLKDINECRQQYLALSHEAKA